jgi:hypothetical protein
MSAFPLVIPPSQQRQNTIRVSNSRDPVEQPIVLPFAFDFAVASVYEIDLTLVLQAGRISGVQTMFADNFTGATAGDTLVLAQGTGATIAVPAGAQMYVAVLASQPCKFVIQNVGGAGVFFMDLLNVPMPFGIWFP